MPYHPLISLHYHPVILLWLRLGLPIAFPEWVNKCDCGRSIGVDGFDADGFHLLTCKTGGGPVWTHDTMVSVWG